MIGKLLNKRKQKKLDIKKRALKRKDLEEEVLKASIEKKNAMEALKYSSDRFEKAISSLPDIGPLSV